MNNETPAVPQTIAIPVGVCTRSHTAVTLPNIHVPVVSKNHFLSSSLFLQSASSNTCCSILKYSSIDFLKSSISFFVSFLLFNLFRNSAFANLNLPISLLNHISSIIISISLALLFHSSSKSNPDQAANDSTRFFLRNQSSNVVQNLVDTLFRSVSKVSSLFISADVVALSQIVVSGTTRFFLA